MAALEWISLRRIATAMAGGAQNDEDHIVQQGVTGDDPGILGGKQELKVFEADKGFPRFPLP